MFSYNSSRSALGVRDYCSLRSGHDSSSRAAAVGGLNGKSARNETIFYRLTGAEVYNVRTIS
jgi:hypothetical protein